MINRGFVEGAFLILLTLFSSTESTIKILDAKRVVILKNPVLEVLSSVSYTNTGSEPVGTLYFSFSAKLKENLAFLSYMDDISSEVVNVKLASETFVKLEGLSNKIMLVPIKLDGSISSGEKRTITFREIYTNLLHSFPETIKQSDSHKVILDVSIYFLSQYVVEKQSFTITYANCILEGIDSDENFIKRSNSEVLSISHSVAPNSEKFARFHFTLNFAMIVHEKLHRKIFISEYGELRFVEWHVIVNKAANLTGGYSRLYEQMGVVKPYVVGGITVYLPLSARNIRYTDSVGNISTSRMEYTADVLKLELNPRFPLYGGWNIEFTLSYTVPTDEFLSVVDGRRLFSTNILGDFHGSYPVNDFEMEIILPENAKYVSFELPDWISHTEARGKLYYYLDYFGRPTYIVSAKNMIGDHDQSFTLKYDHEITMLLLKPLLLSAMISALFLLVTILRKLDLFGSDIKDPAAIFLTSLAKLKERLIETCGLIKDQQFFVVNCFKDNELQLLKDSVEEFRSKMLKEREENDRHNEHIVLIFHSFSLYAEQVLPKLAAALECIEKETDLLCNTPESLTKRKRDSEFASLKKKFDAAIGNAEKLISSL